MTSSSSSTRLFHLENCLLGYANESVLLDVNLTIGSGEKIALIGPSGSGKSTLLRHLQGLLPDVVAYCPQHHGLVPMLSTFHNIFMGQLANHPFWYNLLNLIRPQKKEIEAISLVTEKLQFTSKLFTSIDQLSGGQQQRVNIARALFQNRSIFIGDEPTSSTDIYQGQDIISLIGEQHETVIFALHDIELALNSCQRIIGIKDRRIAIDAPSHTLTVESLSHLYQSHNQ